MAAPARTEMCRRRRRRTNVPNHYPAGGEPTEDSITETLVEAVRAFQDAGVAHLFMGGQVSASVGRPRTSDDIDVFVRPVDAVRALDALAGAGFRVEQTFPDWLYKAFRHGVLVDIIFRSAGDIYIDDEMIRRARCIEVRGVQAPTLAAEDLLVIKAMATQEATAYHWWDALAIISRADDLDWDYLITRARQAGPRRVLSLLLFAESVDLAVPEDAINALFTTLHPPR